MRDSRDYYYLILSAYKKLYNSSEKFRQALVDTYKYKLTHSIGCNDTSKTILTENEFCDMLMYLRDEY